ncbi:MAG: RuBisCO large subunit C-terminal-like domain-containing protein [Gemmatimonadota bacterium]|nr:RuBisCO large subunit C-terminal-like domain-containing protein [Gemmatimonadota bacterium]
MQVSTDGRIRVCYTLTSDGGESAESRARQIALEQTVELPEGCYPREIEREVVGRVEAVEQRSAARSVVTVSYPVDLVGTEIPALLNILWGNISMQSGIVVSDIELPRSVLDAVGGPRFGLEGVRKICGGIEHRPLVLSAAKPVGLSAAALAERCATLARGGIDAVKDDHGVMDQRTAPFRERVRRCQDAVAEANGLTGGDTQYFPNVTAPLDELDDRVGFAREVGCHGVVVSPFLTGLDALRRVADSSEVAVFTHPTSAGGFMQPDHGMTPPVLLGTLLRVLGADGVIYVNAGGRFPVTEGACVEINRRLTAPIKGIRPSVPIPGGGVDVNTVSHLVRRYGVDVMLLIGSSLYDQADLEDATKNLMHELERRSDG